MEQEEENVYFYFYFYFYSLYFFSQEVAQLYVGLLFLEDQLVKLFQGGWELAREALVKRQELLVRILKDRDDITLHFS